MTPQTRNDAIEWTFTTIGDTSPPRDPDEEDEKDDEEGDDADEAPVVREPDED